jgi:hypothetical protein
VNVGVLAFRTFVPVRMDLLKFKYCIKLYQKCQAFYSRRWFAIPFDVPYMNGR